MQQQPHWVKHLTTLLVLSNIAFAVLVYLAWLIDLLGVIDLSRLLGR